MLNPDSLPPLREVISRYGLRAQKKLGQNFLLDSNVTDKIARLAGDLAGKTIFEIGPGPGGLTRSLLRTRARKIIAVEFDPRAVAALEDLRAAAGGRLEVFSGDALETDLTRLATPPRAVVANLPYNIATPLLTGWLRQIHAAPDAFDSMTLMFQKEVAARIAAAPGSKAYGRLSVLCQWLCAAERVYELPPAAFTPPPKVSSSVVRFAPRRLEKGAPAFEAMERVTAAAFGQRRKMIRTSLKDYSERIRQLGLDPALRAENLSVGQYAALALFEDGQG